MRGQTGASMVTRDGTARARRRRRKRQREEARWAALAGPVVVYVDETVRRDRQPEEVAAAAIGSDRL